GLHSFADASFALHLAGVEISSRHVQRIALEGGGELARQRDHKTAQQRRRELPVRVATVPEVVAVEIDGGRLRTRDVGCGPGVHQHQNKEDKIACLVSLKSERHRQDPQPEPPPSFLEPRRVQRLVQQMQGLSGEESQEKAGQEDRPTPTPAEATPPQRPPTPRRQVRACLASMVDSHAFGPMVAAEAQERAFYQAVRRAFVGDGAAYNWWIQRAYFPDFEAITDFLHVLCYLYLAAWGVGADEAQRWSFYVNWLRACWQGRGAEVIEALHGWPGRLGEPPPAEEGRARGRGGRGRGVRRERPPAASGGSADVSGEQPESDGLPALSPAGATDHEQPGGVAGGGVQRPGQGPGEVLEPARRGRGHPPVTCRLAERGRSPRPLLRQPAA